MTTFNDMLTLVTDETRRPELVSLTKSAIRMATLRAHRVASFPRDNRTYRYAFTPNAVSTRYVDVPSIYDLIPQLRTIQMGQCVDPTSLLPVEQLEWRDPADTFDKHGVVRQSIYTLMGNTIRCYPIMQTGILDIFYYADPVVTDAGYASWIADLHPEELAKWAASIVQTRTGAMDIAKMNLQTNIQPFKENLISFYSLPTVS